MARPRAEMRKKIVWPTIYTNIELLALEKTRPWIFKSWTGVLSCSDDFGRFPWNPARMAFLIWAANEERQQGFAEDMNLLAQAGLIYRYGPNQEFGCFPKFADHNSLYKPTPSEYPDPFPSSDLPNPEKERVIEGNRTLTVDLPTINPNKIPPDSPVHSSQTPEVPPAAPRSAPSAKTNGCPHSWPAGPQFCPECNPRPSIGGPAPNGNGRATAPTRTLGFDPHNIKEPLAGYTVEQIQKIVRYHWDESDNPFWREKTRSKEFFERNLPKMAESIPESWLNPKRIQSGKKPFMHPKPGLRR